MTDTIVQLNARSIGAVGDGATLDTAAIQEAIDRCSEVGGGEVVLPPGRYLSGTLILKDGVTLYLAAGATLLGSTREEDYSPLHLIRAQGARNIGLAGPGTIDGQAAPYPTRDWKKLGPDNDDQRQKFAWVPHFGYRHSPCKSGDLIRLLDCQNVRINDLTLTRSPFWTLNIIRCNDVSIRGVRIRNPLYFPNSDGIDICACNNVSISDCDIVTGDDAICLKDGIHDIWGPLCSNVTVTNCRLTTACNAFKIGTATHGDFENIVVSNCVFCGLHPSDPMAEGSVETLHPDHIGDALAPISGIAIESVDGGHVRGVAVSNIVMQNVRAPIFIRLGHRAENWKVLNAKPEPGTIRDISISNVLARGAAVASSITGIPGHPVQGISLRNIRIECSGGGDPALKDLELPELESRYPEATMWGPMPVCGIYCRHAKDLSLCDLNIACSEPDPRPMMHCEDICRLHISDFVLDGTSGNELIRFKNLSEALIGNVIAEPKCAWQPDNEPHATPVIRTNLITQCSLKRI